MILFHNSSVEFEKFDISYAGNNSERAYNSALGLWFSANPEWLNGFGGFQYQVNVDDHLSYVLPIEKLRKMEENGNAEDMNFWLTVRQSLLDKGYKSISLKESMSNDYTDDNGISMYIIIDDTIIHDCKIISRPEENMSPKF